MINAIKMDLYRLYKTKSTYVIWCIMAFVLILSSATLKMMDNTTTVHVNDTMVMEDSSDDLISGIKDGMMEEPVVEEEPINIGLSVGLPESQENYITVYDVIYGNVQGKLIALFIVIFAVLFATSDLNSGYIKNIGGQVEKRGCLIISKAVSIFVYTVATMVLSVLIQIVANAVFLGYIKWGNLKDFFVYMSTETFLHFAFACICMTIAVLVRNNMVSMILAVCMTMNVLTILYGVLQKLITKMGIKNFKILDYTITGKISMLSNHVTTKESISAICLSIVFVIIMVVLGKSSFEKKDI